MSAAGFYAALSEPPAARIVRRAKARHQQGRILLAAAGQFIDHSTPDCGCGERAGSSHSSAQPDPGGEAGSGTNFQQ